MKTKHKRRMIISGIILAIVLSQLVISAIHHSRYRFDDDRYEDYCCVQMSRDCERFFESLGINVYQMKGERDTETENGEGGYETERHRWILLDFGWFQIPYESTYLVPWNPTWRGYENVFICDGYVIDGEYFENETDLTWQKYN